jgi:acetylglutamate kinase
VSATLTSQVRPLLVKIGGSMAEDDTALKAMARTLANFAQKGRPLILVHGGGKDINRHLAWLGEEPRFKNGLRVTSEEALKVVEMTLSGYVNKKLVGFLADAGAKPAGLSGVDGPTFFCEPIDPELGRVGRITHVDTTLVATLMQAGFLPVVSPISVGPGGEPESGLPHLAHFNVNADDAASALAMALNAEKLVFISDVPGVLDGQKAIVPSLDAASVARLTAEGVVQGGMIPKLRSCLAAVAAGVGEVHICGFTGESDLQAQLSGARNSGTIVT